MSEDDHPEGGTVPSALPPDPAAVANGSSFWTAYQGLMYGLSCPERALRSTTALVGGAVHEAGQFLVPQAFRTSRSYSFLIQQSLDFLLSEVGGVERPSHKDGASLPNADAAQGVLARKAVGGFLDLAGVAALHVSPMTVLAIVSDVAYGSQSYLKELCDELKKAGVIDESSSIRHVADLLVAVENASRRSCELFDAPPLSVEGLKETIRQATLAVRDIDVRQLIPRSEMEAMWTDIRAIARQEKVSSFEVSSSLALYAMDKAGIVGQGALSSATVAGNLFDRHIFEHYRTGLGQLQQKGLYAFVAESYRPYVDAIWQNFSSSKPTITEELLSGRLLGRSWRTLTGWFTRNTEPT